MAQIVCNTKKWDGVLLIPHVIPYLEGIFDRFEGVMDCRKTIRWSTGSIWAWGLRIICDPRLNMSTSSHWRSDYDFRRSQAATWVPKLRILLSWRGTCFSKCSRRASKVIPGCWSRSQKSAIADDEAKKQQEAEEQQKAEDKRQQQFRQKWERAEALCISEWKNRSSCVKKSWTLGLAIQMTMFVSIINHSFWSYFTNLAIVQRPHIVLTIIDL